MQIGITKTFAVPRNGLPAQEKWVSPKPQDRLAAGARLAGDRLRATRNASLDGLGAAVDGVDALADRAANRLHRALSAGDVVDPDRLRREVDRQGPVRGRRGHGIQADNNRGNAAEEGEKGGVAHDCYRPCADRAPHLLVRRLIRWTRDRIRRVLL